MMITLAGVLACALVLSTAQASDVFSESLKLVRMTETLTLMSFNFDFTLEEEVESHVRRIDSFPA